MTTETTPWIKATKSTGNGGDCFEVRRHNGQIEVRDSKQGDNGPTLRFTTAEFDALLDGAKKGEFDHLLS
jgi:hypothetical protein